MLTTRPRLLQAASSFSTRFAPRLARGTASGAGDTFFADSTFADTGLTQATTEALARSGFTTPSHIQLQVRARRSLLPSLSRPGLTRAAQAIPSILRGADTVITAETGSGKTIAYLAPILDAVAEESPPATPQALVLAPTRELVAQLRSVACALRPDLTKHIVPAWGAHRINTRLPCALVIATPQAAAQHLRDEPDYFSAVTAVVADEADLLLSGSYRDDVTATLQRFARHVTPRPAIVLAAISYARPIPPLPPALPSLPPGCAPSLDSPARDPASVRQGLSRRLDCAPPSRRHHLRHRLAAPRQAVGAASIRVPGAAAEGSGRCVRSQSHITISRFCDTPFPRPSRARVPDPSPAGRAGRRRRVHAGPRGGGARARGCHRPGRGAVRAIRRGESARCPAVLSARAAGHAGSARLRQHGAQRAARGARPDAVRPAHGSHSQEGASAAASIVPHSRRSALTHALFPLLAAACAAQVSGQRREDELRAFREGATQVLVATDVASRGVDLPNASHVVQAEFALDVTSHLHRVGRTARAAAEGKGACNKGLFAFLPSLLMFLAPLSCLVPTPQRRILWARRMRI